MAAGTRTSLPEEEERAVLIGLVLQQEPEDEALRSLEELARLAETAGVEVLDAVVQRRAGPDPKWLIGRGKVEELRLSLRGLGATTVIFNKELSGTQVRNLEAALEVKIIDRTQLILDIFATRARTREGMLQVELAQLNYLLPRLSGRGRQLSRLGGGIGTRGPGETKLETDRRHIRRRIADLRRQLADVVRHRALYRERRKKNGIFQAALVGYTNAGKSTLLNRLSGSQVLADDMLFATLDPASRHVKLPSGRDILLTDTVGFIRDLPHDLVAAFRATLEEVLDADLIVHVADASSPSLDSEVRVVEQVLEMLGASGKETLMVYNKIDRCTAEDIAALPSGTGTLKISALNDGDLERLKAELDKFSAGKTAKLRLPADRGDLIALAHRTGEVLKMEPIDDGGALLLTIRLNAKTAGADAGKLDPYYVS